MSNAWLQKLWKQQSQMRLADRAVQLLQGQRRASLVNRLVQLTQDRMFGLRGEPVMNHDDMIQIDSPTTHHHYPSTPSATGSVAKLAAWGLLASGVAAPLSVAVWKLPEIVSALRTAEPSRAATSSRPSEPSRVATDVPTTDFDLYVGPPAEGGR
jgi:hypothetical protein